jgi:predicted outer membrane repeat protein
VALFATPVNLTVGGDISSFNCLAPYVLSCSGGSTTLNYINARNIIIDNPTSVAMDFNGIESSFNIQVLADLVVSRPPGLASVDSSSAIMVQTSTNFTVGNIFSVSRMTCNQSPQGSGTLGTGAALWIDSLGTAVIRAKNIFFEHNLATLRGGAIAIEPNGLYHSLQVKASTCLSTKPRTEALWP